MTEVDLLNVAIVALSETRRALDAVAAERMVTAMTVARETYPDAPPFASDQRTVAAALA